jgi:hypothetical protein
MASVYLIDAEDTRIFSRDLRFRAEIIEKSAAKYREAFERLTGVAVS